MSSPNTYGGRGNQVVGVGWGLMGLTTLLLVLRVLLHVTRAKEAIRGLPALLWAWAAWIPGTLTVSFFTVAAWYGFGNHIQNLEDAGAITPAIKWQWVADSMAALAIGIGKFAIVTFYLAIQGPTAKWGRRFLLFLAISNLANNIVSLFLIYFQCSPVEALWDKSIAGTCSKHVSDANFYFGTAGASWNAATDIVLALYPVRIVYHLQMPKRVKFGLCILMGLGIFTAVCSIVKTYELKSVEASDDPTYSLAALAVWGMAEMWLVLITASIPPLWPIVRGIGERAAALSRLSSEHSLSSIFTCRRTNAARADSEAADDHRLYEVARGNSIDRHLPLEGGDGIIVQKAITMTRELGCGSSGVSTAGRALQNPGLSKALS